MSHATGSDRFQHFKAQMRSRALSMQLQSQHGNMEVWQVTGPKGSMRIAAFIGEHGFDLFHESADIEMGKDIAAIEARVS